MHHITLKTTLLLLLLTCATPLSASIEVGRGNSPVRDSNWPAGSLDLANLKTRVGWWVGPPFGGGQHQFLYRGDTAAFQAALDLFAKIRAPGLQLFIHEGPHENQFLRDDSDPKSDTRVDWTFTVWDPRSYHQLYNNPASTFTSDDPSGRFRAPIEAPRLDLYVAPAKAANAKGIDFTKIKVPANVKVTDERASAHGYKPDDKSILLGDAFDMLTSKPIPGAQITISQHKGGQAGWAQVAAAPADAQGRFELKKIPAGNYRVTLFANGYVPRVLGYAQFGENTLKEYSVYLTTPVKVSGTVNDASGKPIPGVVIRADRILAFDGRGYILPDTLQTISDADGNFELLGAPKGHLHLFAQLKPYYLLDSLKLHAAPADNIALVMTTTGTIKGKVVKADGKPADGHVHVDTPGRAIGSWGGSTVLNADGSFQFDNVPPGTYILSSQPINLPGLPKDPFAKTIEVKPGKITDVDITTE